jgi:predicted outer membrane repeat protein
MSGSSTFTNCEFLSNTVTAGEFAFDAYGGAMSVLGGSPVLHGCSFVNNTILLSGFTQGRGGALYVDSSAELIDCTFIGNAIPAPGPGVGGAVAINQGATLTGCEFRENSALNAGALLNNAAATSIIDCTFESNIAEGNGGAISTYGGTFSSCRIIGNEAWEGGGSFPAASSPATLQPGAAPSRASAAGRAPGSPTAR